MAGPGSADAFVLSPQQTIRPTSRSGIAADVFVSARVRVRRPHVFLGARRDRIPEHAGNGSIRRPRGAPATQDPALGHLEWGTRPVLIYVQKERALEAMQRHYPSAILPNGDDKPQRPAAMKRMVGERLTTGSVHRGPSRVPIPGAIRQHPSRRVANLEIERIGALLDLEPLDLLAAWPFRAWRPDQERT